MNTETYVHLMHQARVLAHPAPHTSYCVRCQGWVRRVVCAYTPPDTTIIATLECGHAETVRDQHVVDGFAPKGG